MPERTGPADPFDEGKAVRQHQPHLDAGLTIRCSRVCRGGAARRVLVELESVGTHAAATDQADEFPLGRVLAIGRALTIALAMNGRADRAADEAEGASYDDPGRQTPDERETVAHQAMPQRRSFSRLRNRAQA